MLRRSTIAAVLIAIAAVAVLLVQPRGGGRESMAGGGGALLPAGALPADAVTRIELDRAGAPRMVFERAGQGWAQVEPFAFPMDAFSIRQLAVLGSALAVARKIERGAADASAAGLDPPQAEITWHVPAGPLTVRFGRRAAAGRFYVRVEGDPATYVATGDLYERAVEMDPKEWRDRTLFPESAIDATAIRIDDGATPVVLERQRKRWMITAPLATRMDAAAANELLSALARARSGGFIVDAPADPATFGLSPPAATLEVSFGGDARRLLVGGRMGVGSEDRFGMVEGRPTVVRLPEPVLRALVRPLASLIDPTASGAIAADVKSIVIRGPAGDRTLQRDLERWLEGPAAEVDAKAVEELLTRLTTERAAEIRIEQYPRDLHVASVIVIGFDARPIDTVRIAREPGGGRWLLENGDGVLRVFPPGTRMPFISAPAPGASSGGRADMYDGAFSHSE